MIDFEKFILDNGLKVIVHRDSSSPIAAVNLLYNIGAKDENPDKTGFAHLFEHLMFGGSRNIPVFDEALHLVGGENNAFTNNDFTNYYITIPKSNIETAFWLESDRMLSLAFSEKSLEVQRNVVIEEYKQRYLNQPYGDIWLLLRPLVYKKHPYRWATIGKDISHIENAKMQDVKDFFFKYYAPNNCILSVVGDVDINTIRTLAEKWFGPIPQRNVPKRSLVKEPPQTEGRSLTVKKDVPLNAIYKAWHMCSRTDKDYYATDLISDILSNGKSSRLVQRLVKGKKLFSSVNAYISGDIDKGMFIVTGNPLRGVSMEDAESAILEEITEIKEILVNPLELEKVKNNIESNILFSDISNLNKAMSLSYFELLGDASLKNKEVEKYRLVSENDIKRVANDILVPENCSTIYYLSNR